MLPHFFCSYLALWANVIIFKPSVSYKKQIKFAQPNGCVIFDNQMVVFMIERRDVFQAIADPTRRRIIQKLSGGSLNLAKIGEDMEMSRQAIAKHIKVLNECGMVSITQKGREQFCEARLSQLDEVMDWVYESRKLWNQRFEKLDKFLKETKNQQI
jgi:DNA-binding transcriptional ArsR family regulator